MSFFSSIFNIGIVFACLLLSACVAPDTTLRQRYVWPPPPDEPRIEWLGVYHSQLDLESTFFRRLKEAVVGEDAPIALIKPVEARNDAVENKLYVADLEAASVFVFDMANSDLRVLPFQNAKLSKRPKPIALALDGERNVYVLEAGERKILVFDRDEKFVRVLEIGMICRRPIALAIDRERSRLYVSDAETSTIHVFDYQGNSLFAIGGPGDETGKLNRPVGMVVNSRGELLVADSFNARIQVFDSQGKFLKSFGTRGTGLADFQLIKSVAVDGDDNIYVADGRANNIKIFNQNGNLLLAFGGYYAVASTGKIAPGGFALPICIDIDSSGRLFVVDQLNARVQVFKYLSPVVAGKGVQQSND